MFPGLAASDVVSPRFPARGRRRRGAARMRRGETAQRWHLFVVSTSERLPAALPPARTRVFSCRPSSSGSGSGYFRASRLGDFLTFANRPPPPPPPTAVPQDFQDQEDHGQEAEAERPSPVDPHAHRQHHRVVPPPGSLGFFFAPSKASFAAAQTARSRAIALPRERWVRLVALCRATKGRTFREHHPRPTVGGPSAPTPLMRRVPTARFPASTGVPLSPPELATDISILLAFLPQVQRQAPPPAPRKLGL